MVVLHPEILARYEEQFTDLRLASGRLEKLRSAILDIFHADAYIDPEGLRQRLDEAGFSPLVAELTAPGAWGAVLPVIRGAAVDAETAEMAWCHILERHHLAAGAEERDPL